MVGFGRYRPAVGNGLVARNRVAGCNGRVLPALFFEEVQDGRSSVRILFILKQPLIAADILGARTCPSAEPAAKREAFYYVFRLPSGI
jgi:hypothetical protein